jgi:hypothetical protein
VSGSTHFITQRKEVPDGNRKLGSQVEPIDYQAHKRMEPRNGAQKEIVRTRSSQPSGAPSTTQEQNHYKNYFNHVTHELKCISSILIAHVNAKVTNAHASNLFTAVRSGATVPDERLCSIDPAHYVVLPVLL